MQNPKEIRSFRLGKELLGMLQVSARRHGITESALVEGILERYLRADTLVQGFDYIGVGRETFLSMLGMTDANGLEIAGAERGKKAFALARELYESNGLELEFLDYLSDVLGNQARWFRVEGTYIRPERVTLQHGYGLKWSGFLRSYLSSVYEAVSRNKLELLATDEYVSIRFPKATPQ